VLTLADSNAHMVRRWRGASRDGVPQLRQARTLSADRR